MVQPHGIPTVSPSTVSDTTYDIIVIGSGVLGTALSVSLARSGRKVLVVERDLAPPHSRIVGELLQPGGCLSLDKLGLLDALEDIDAVPCKGYMVIYDKLGSTKTPYPQNMNIIQNATRANEWNSTTLQEGRSFHHGNFVGSLRKALINQENLDVLQGTVNDLITCSAMGNKVIGVKITPKDDSGSSSDKPIEAFAPLTIVADGYASKFRKFVNPDLPAPIARSYFVGIELENCDLPAPHHGHVVLPPSSSSSSSAPSSSTAPRIGPVLLYMISPTTTRMLIDISTSKTPTKAYLREHITSLLPESIRPSFLEAVSDSNPQKVKAMPNSFLPPRMQGGKTSKEGVLLAGDALNMRHPLTGGGMSVALNDVVILTELLGGGRPLVPTSRSSSPSMNGNGHANGYANGHPNGHANGHANGSAKIDSEKETSDDDASSTSSLLSSSPSSSMYDREICELQDWWDVKSRLEEWHWRRKGVATCVNVLAMALYCLFGAEDANLDVLRMGCFKYFLLGGDCVQGPVSMLSALNPSPPLLLYHFFRVAFYSIYLLFTEPRPRKDGGKPAPPSIFAYPALFWQSIIVFWTACTVILPVLWSEIDF
ncbi:SE-domain-containing protein [Cystobasidium minutum MCA 4210]|uniref:SE-domain-containing protein n=1 Tax=Cystobasidium minutum MCA 4210 TaxID=1397322 RepID=UPI0034CF82C1|eukprot:jgi/Rhomi1/196145/gm1.4359_g